MMIESSEYADSDRMLLIARSWANDIWGGIVRKITDEIF